MTIQRKIDPYKYDFNPTTMKKFIVLFFCMTSFLYCKNEVQEDLKPLDLLKWGIPITILAPDSAQVKTMDMGGLLKDVTIKGDNNYYIQIYASDAATTDIARIKSDQLAEVKANRYFSKIVSEEEDGFIYENAVDSANIYYGFRHIRVQGDMEYVFQTGLIGSFTQEEVEKMNGAVQPDVQ